MSRVLERVLNTRESSLESFLGSFGRIGYFACSFFNGILSALSRSFDLFANMFLVDGVRYVVNYMFFVSVSVVMRAMTRVLDYFFNMLRVLIEINFVNLKEKYLNMSNFFDFGRISKCEGSK